MLIMNRIIQPWYWIDWLYYLLPAGKQFKSTLDILHGFTKEVGIYYRDFNNTYLKRLKTIISFTNFFTFIERNFMFTTNMINSR